MFKKTKIIILLLIIFLSLYLFLPGYIFASTVRIDQPKVRLSIPAGTAKTGAIKVENASALPVNLKVYLEDWYYLPPFDGSKEFKPAGTQPLSCANWITFVPAEFTIPAYGKQMVNFTVNVPDEVKGGHYAVMFFESQLGEAPKEEGVVVNVMARIGSLFYIEPEGTINKRVNLENFSVVRHSKDLPLEVQADFHNIGNVDITAEGTYYIIDKEGVVYARGEFNGVYTLPADKATIKATWEEPIPTGSFDIVLTLDLGKGESLVKEAEVRIGSDGAMVYVGSLK